MNSEKVNRIVVMSIDMCGSDCPYFKTAESVIGEIYYCCNPKPEIQKEIFGIERGKDFPSWCPLEKDE